MIVFHELCYVTAKLLTPKVQDMKEQAENHV